MNELQKKLYVLLCEIDDICTKHGITYYLAAGGALGAVRNGGFLPWDDDLDLYITRDNWEKLIKIMDEEIADNRNFVYQGKNPYYYNPIGRYVDEESTFQMRSLLLPGDCGGVFVEFFLFDPLPTDLIGKEHHKKTLKLYTELTSPYFSFNHSLFDSHGEFEPGKFVKYHERTKQEGINGVCKELQAVLESTEDDNCEDYCMRYGKITYIFPKETFGNGRKISFEGRKFPVPDQIERIFRIGYGDDWMCVPDIEGRINHPWHGDFNVPYEQYVNIYMPLVDKDDYLDACYAVKENINDNIPNLTQILEKKSEIKLAIAKKKIEFRKFNTGELRNLLETKSYDELKEAFSIFEEAQGDRVVSRTGEVVDVSDEYMEIYLRYLVETDRYYKAARLINKLENKNRGDISPQMAEIKKICDGCREISIGIFDKKNISAVSDTLDKIEYDERIPNHQLARLFIGRQKADETGEYGEFLKESMRALETCGHSGDVRGNFAYGLYMTGDRAEALREYEIACKTTNNAFIWREASELVGINMYDKKADKRDPLESELLKLYCELETICKENKLACITTGQTAKRFMGLDHSPIVEINVAMTLSHIEKAAEIVDKDFAGRSIDFDKDACQFSFCNEDSTLILSGKYENEKRHIIKIGIIPIEKVGGKVSRKLKSLIKRFIRSRDMVLMNSLGYRAYKKVADLPDFSEKFIQDCKIGKVRIKHDNKMEITEGLYEEIPFLCVKGLNNKSVKKEKRTISEHDLFVLDGSYSYETLIDEDIDKLIHEYFATRRKYDNVKNEAREAYKRKAVPWNLFNMAGDIIRLRRISEEIDVTDFDNRAAKEALDEYGNLTKKWRKQGIDFPPIEEYENALKDIQHITIQR